MKILIAEDEPGILETYKIMLEDRGHEVVLTSNGEECVRAYGEAMKKLPATSQEYLASHPPFDVVMLDYRMPKMDGMEAAKFILEVNEHQRIIFASAYVLSTLKESIKYLHVMVELLQKPFDLDLMVDIIEDTSVYDELKINVDVKSIKSLNPTHEQIRDLLKGLNKLKIKTPLIDC